MQGSKVGYGHTTQTVVTEDGRRLVKVVGETDLTVKRFAQVTTMHIECIDWETLDGELVRFECTTRLGPTPQVTRGRCEPGKLVIATDNGRETTVPLPQAVRLGGFNAVDQSLAQLPMKPGEIRTIESLWPVINQPATTTLVAKSFEPTEMLTGSYELLRIDATTAVTGSPPIDSTLWCDRSGEVLKNRIDAFDQTGYRTTRDAALGQPSSPTFDLGDATLVKVEKPLDDPHHAKRIRYKVTLAGGDPARAFATGQSQQVRLLGPREAEVTVRALRPDSPLIDGLPADPPTDADRQTSAMIQSDDPAVQALAAEVDDSNGDAWATAKQLESLVHRKIRAKNFSQALASAAEVAKSLEGDCTEHAVLLAAVARARGLPSRVALGLVYIGHPPAMGFHMWTEIYVGDPSNSGRWIPMDATLGQGGIGAGHLKLADSSLAEGEGLASFLSVAQVLGRLRIDVAEVER